MPARKTRSILTLACLAALVVAAGCARNARHANRSQGAEGADLISPVVMGGDNGLELRWWIVSDETGDRLASSLGAYTQLTAPMDASVQDRWRKNGLRLVRAPLDDLPSIKASLPIVGRVDRHWLGQTPRWTELLQGESIASQARVLRYGKPADMNDGRIRLLGRAWTSPAPTGAVLRADLALQHVPRTGASMVGVDAISLSRRLASEAKGSVMTDLTANMALEPGYAYLIVPEDPARTWLAGGSMPRMSMFDWGELAGPPAPPMPTIGEALLTAAPLQAGRTDLRAVVILIPRTPTQFNLLSASPIASSN